MPPRLVASVLVGGLLGEREGKQGRRGHKLQICESKPAREPRSMEARGRWSERGAQNLARSTKSIFQTLHRGERH